MMFNRPKSTKKITVSQESAARIMKMILIEELIPEEQEKLLDDKSELEDAVNENIMTESVAEELVEYNPVADKATLMAVYSRAEAADDEDFKKLTTALSVVKELNERLVDKYGKEAGDDVAEVVDQAEQSESEVVAEAAKRYKRRNKK